jgi:ABC transporter DrrB family efflux protein
VDVWEEIGRLSAGEGLTVLLTTHYLEEADRLAARSRSWSAAVRRRGSPDELKSELRGDTLQLELGAPEANGRLQVALDGVDGLRDIVVDGRTLRARAVVDRFLVSPARRGALIAGPLAQQSIVIAIQTAIIVLIGVAAGARFLGGVSGVLVLIAVSILLGVGMGALSNALALVARKEETVIAAVQFIVLPMSFLSTAFMQRGLVPGWIGDIARFNPANWAVEAGREALGESVDWGLVLSRAGFLTAFVAACALLATGAFRAYQKSV